MSEPNPKTARSRYEAFESVPIRIVVRVGAARCTVARLSSLETGDVLVLDRALGEPFDLVVADRTVGRVEPVLDEDGVSVKLVEVLSEETDEPR